MAEEDSQLDENMQACFIIIGIALGVVFLLWWDVLVTHIWTIVTLLLWVLGIGIVVRVLSPLVKRIIEAIKVRKMAKVLKQELVTLSATIDKTSRCLKSATTFSDELKSKWEEVHLDSSSEFERYKAIVKAELDKIDFSVEGADNVSLAWVNGQCEVKVNGRS